LQETAIQVIQYPNFMAEIKNVRREIAVEESPTLNQQREDNDVSKTHSQKERETPVVEMKSKHSLIRRLLATAASLLLIFLAYYLISTFQQSSSPMASTTNLIIKFESGRKGEGIKESPLQQGIELFKDEDYQDAIPLFDQVIRETPIKRADAQFLKAHALHNLDRKDEARAVLQSIKKADNEKHYKEVTPHTICSVSDFYFSN